MISSAFAKAFARRIVLGEAVPWSTWKVVALSTPAAVIADGATIAEVTLALPDMLDIGEWTVQPYQPPEWILPNEPPAAPDVPEVLPYAELDTLPEWTNAGGEAVTVRAIAIIGQADDAWHLLMWEEVEETEVEPEDTYSPPNVRFRIYDRANTDSLRDPPVFGIEYETVGHCDAAKHTSGVPSRMMWRDIHNESDDPTLAQQFAQAMERLERMLYAVYGSLPASYSPFADWWHRLHPRCLWGAEQWNLAWCGEYDIFGDPICDGYFEVWETAALGASWSGKIPRPTVPVRSRSGDPRRQMLRAAAYSNRRLFPFGSVTRSGDQDPYGGGSTYDPRGDGDFGGDPADIGGDGDVHIDGDEVTITATPTEPVEEITLHYNGSSVAMTETDGVWSATIGPFDHGTTVSWYLEVTTADGVVYEPGGASPPSPEQQYTFVAFSHWCPYPHGLPEMWSKCAKGTDGYEFTDDETIQYQLINLVRWTLDDLGSKFFHSPRVLGGVPKCCYTVPIEWQWSGSAPWPHYVSGGKIGTSPLTNLDDEPEGVDLAARRSWRGHPAAYPSYPGAANHEYASHGPPAASWKAPPTRIPDPIYWPVRTPTLGSCEIYWHGGDRGLQPGDVIDAVHIRELIAAIDYLANNGLWTLAEIRRRMLTPTWLDCGHWRMGYHETWPGYEHEGIADYYHPTHQCCASVEFIDGIETCIPFDAPSDWSDCWENGPHGFCSVITGYRESCVGTGGTFNETAHYMEEVVSCCGGASTCFEPTPPCAIPVLLSPPTILTHHAEVFSSDTCSASQGDRAGCGSCNVGWAGYVCGPRRCPGGCDDQHGNGIIKSRYLGADCCGGDPPFCPASNGGIWSNGNCFGDVYICGHTAGGLHTIPFEAVTEVHFPGPAPAWVGQGCDGLCPNDEFPRPSAGDITFAELPGYTDFYDPDENYICSTTNFDDPGEFPEQCRHDARCDVTLNLDACTGDYVWVAVDLNIDGVAPYARHEDWDGDPTERMPTLRDYVADPGEDYEPYVSECPCRTWTGPATCEQE